MFFMGERQPIHTLPFAFRMWKFVAMNSAARSYSMKDILPTGNYINGKWMENGNGKAAILDKYSSELLVEIPLAQPEQVEEAIAAASRMASDFRKWSAAKRRLHIERLLGLFKERAEAFAQLIAAEAGKPISYARGEVARCQTTLQLAADEATRFTGETVNIDYNAGEGRRAFTIRVPIGPVACISPFNFPLNLALHKIAPALAVGCPIVLKPSPFAPLSSIAFAALCEAAGYPAGFVNIFLADVSEAESIVVDERLKLLSFTGSPQIGWMLKAKAGKKPVVLELGGNAAAIVDETADLAHAARRIAIGGYLYAGQICISTQRILVEESVFEAFQGMLVKEIEALKVGDPRDEKVMVGPMIDQMHLERVEEWVGEAVAGGARLLTGGFVLSRPHALFAPTLLTGTQPDQKVSCKEVFGPVALVESYSSFQEALDTVNDSDFGLQAGVFTNRLDHMRLALEELEVGGIIMNDVPGFRVDGMPYGGVKDSGLGREGLRYAMEDMTETRLLVY